MFDVSENFRSARALLAAGSMLRPLVIGSVLLVAPAASAQQATTTSLVVTSPERPQHIVVEPLGNDPPPPTVCITPCNLTVAPGTYLLRAEAPTLRRYQSTIVVPPEGRNLQLRVATKRGFVWSIVWMGLGGMFMTSSGIMLSQFAMGASLDDGYNQMMAAVWGTGFLTGAAFLTGGYFKYRANRSGPEE